MATLDSHREAVKQVAVADRLILTKLDRTNTTDAEAMRARLTTLNPSATLLDNTCDPAQLLDTSLAQAGVSRWLAFDRVAAAFAHLRPRGAGAVFRWRCARSTRDEPGAGPRCAL